MKLAVLAFPLSFLFAKLSGAIINSPRPFVIQHIEPLIKASTDNGFPSDHTLLAMTIAAIIFVYNRKAGLFLVTLSLFVGLGRIFANVHHLIDILGSIVIAFLVTFISYKYLQDLLNRNMFGKLRNQLKAK